MPQPEKYYDWGNLFFYFYFPNEERTETANSKKKNTEGFGEPHTGYALKAFYK